MMDDSAIFSVLSVSITGRLESDTPRNELREAHITDSRADVVLITNNDE